MKKTEKITKGISRAEALERLKEAAVLTDAEVAHSQADDVLLDYINDEEIRAAFVAIRKWHA